MVWKKINYGQM
jgi:serine/threonine protein kinase